MFIQRFVPFFAMNLFLASLAFQVGFVVSVFRLPVLGRKNPFFLGRLDCCKTF